MKRILSLVLLLLTATQSVYGFDCDSGVYAGMGESNGIVSHTTCGGKWRAILTVPLKQDDDDWWGFTNNSYDYMIGIGYQWGWKKLRFDAGLLYVNEKTKLYDERQGPLWLRVGYQILPSLNCGIVHSSVMFVSDPGRNQVGCDYTFSFD